jgi:hypothetical protein
MAASYKHLTITVDWFGPYTSVEEAATAAKEDFEDGLYLVAGKRKSQHGKPCLQYVGIAKRLATRLFTSEGVKSVTRDRKIWLGEISSSAPPGKKTKATKPTIDLAEWAHAYFLRLPCNTKKKASPPPRPVTVLNRWWKKDYETPARQRPHRDWPDVIDYLGNGYGGRAAWFGQARYERFMCD